MISRIALAALCASLAFSAAADETPNIQPGEWENTSSVKFTGEIPIPEQSDTSTQCITAEDISNGAFMQDMDGCTVTNQDIRSDGMDMTMTCDQAGMSMTMTADMEFGGDSMEGTIEGEMESPMGPMQMTVTLSGRRIGDC